MKNPSYMDNKITWQVHAVMMVELESLTSGRFPNGKKMDKKDREESQFEIDACRKILFEHGITQLKLF